MEKEYGTQFNLANYFLAKLVQQSQSSIDAYVKFKQSTEPYIINKQVQCYRAYIHALVEELNF